MSGHQVDLTGILDAGDVEQLLSSGGAVRDDADDAGGELRRLSRRLSGQVVDQLVHFASEAFGGERRSAEGLEPTLAALRRLAAASHDAELRSAIDDLGALLARPAGRGRVRRVRRMAALREWILDFAALLEGEDARRVRGLVRFEPGTQPLLAALREVDGIGPRRLEQLYCAGLYQVEVLTRASPDEVSAVTGLTHALATEVIGAARRFADQRRRRCAEALVRTAGELREVARAADGRDPELEQAAREAIRALSALLDMPGQEER